MRPVLGLSGAWRAHYTVRGEPGASGPWRRVLSRLSRTRMAWITGFVVLFYFCIALGVWLDLWGDNWAQAGASMWGPTTGDYWFGTDLLGRDIFARTLAGAATAFEIGLTVTILSTLIGALLGGIAGLAPGSLTDEAVLWLAGVIDAIPFYLFVIAVAFALAGEVYAMHIAMVTAFWTLTARLVRAEIVRLKELPFVEAARALGVGEMTVLFRHLLPNTSAILLVQFSLIFIAAIKVEVILSFLGLGLREGVSWGIMIAESIQAIPAGELNAFLAASLALMGLVLAFNLFVDLLQTALDPRSGHAGRA